MDKGNELWSLRVAYFAATPVGGTYELVFRSPVLALAAASKIHKIMRRSSYMLFQSQTVEIVDSFGVRVIFNASQIQAIQICSTLDFHKRNVAAAANTKELMEKHPLEQKQMGF